MRAPVSEENQPLYEYTLMPTHMRGPFRVDELQDIELVEPFTFTKGCRTMKIKVVEGSYWAHPYPFGTLLFDLQNDPKQGKPVTRS